MNNKSTIVFIIIFIVVVAGAVAYGIAVENKSAENGAVSSEAEMKITPKSFDFGEVSQAEGVVETSFKIENNGASDLIIDNMVSSCMCTSAALKVAGKEGPKFGMHNNPRNWSETIVPGGTAELIVYYDPDVHKDFRGSATREVTLTSNDKNNAEKSVTIRLNQVD